jgi:hypothetical protein
MQQLGASQDTSNAGALPLLGGLSTTGLELPKYDTDEEEILLEKQQEQ